MNTKISQKEYLKRYLQPKKVKKKRKNVIVGHKTVKLIDDDIDTRKIGENDDSFRIFHLKDDIPQIVNVKGTQKSVDFTDKQSWRTVNNDKINDTIISRVLDYSGFNNKSKKSKLFHCRQKVETNKLNSRIVDSGRNMCNVLCKNEKLQNKKSYRYDTQDCSTSNKYHLKENDHSSDSDISIPRNKKVDSFDSDLIHLRSSNLKDPVRALNTCTSSRPIQSENQECKISSKKQAICNDFRLQINSRDYELNVGSDSDSDISLPRSKKTTQNYKNHGPNVGMNQSRNLEKKKNDREFDDNQIMSSKLSLNHDKSKASSKYSKFGKQLELYDINAIPENNSNCDIDINKHKKQTYKCKTRQPINALSRSRSSQKQYNQDVNIKKLDYQFHDSHNMAVLNETKLCNHKIGDAINHSGPSFQGICKCIHEECSNTNECPVWNKGLKQMNDRLEKHTRDLYEMTKPLARYIDDKDLDNDLRNREVSDDPMLAQLRMKQIIKGKHNSDMMKCEGCSSNRYGIRPGLRWDGVDRSNGYENKWFEAISSKKISANEAYQWGTSDM